VQLMRRAQGRAVRVYRPAGRSLACAQSPSHRLENQQKKTHGPLRAHPRDHACVAHRRARLPPAQSASNGPESQRRTRFLRCLELLFKRSGCAAGVLTCFDASLMRREVRRGVFAVFY